MSLAIETHELTRFFNDFRAVALSVLAIHSLGDAISPPLIGRLSDRTSLGEAVLVVPVAVALCGLLWIAAAWRCRQQGVQA